jgi:hypothetical protein
VDVIPKPRVFTSEARDLARIATNDFLKGHGFSHAETGTNLDDFSR